MNPIPITQIDRATATFDDFYQIADVCDAAWPSADASAERSAVEARAKQHLHKPGMDLHYVVRHGGQIMAHARCFPREIGISGTRVVIWALAGVCTRPEHRKRGLGRAVVRACFAHVDRGEYPWCLFQTSHPNRVFYESLGAAVLSNRFFNSLADPPDPNPWHDNLQMAYPGHRAFPEGVVDLLGPAY